MGVVSYIIALRNKLMWDMGLFFEFWNSGHYGNEDAVTLKEENFQREVTMILQFACNLHHKIGVEIQISVEYALKSLSYSFWIPCQL